LTDPAIVTATANCAICLAGVAPGEEGVVACPACGAPYHTDCWSDNGGCGVYGCRLVPKTEGLKPLEIPPAFWGREDKDCPRCGLSIMAMAVRCRHCGAAVEARPADRATYQRQQSRRAAAPALRRIAILLVAGALIPGIAAIAAVAGWIIYRRRRADIRAMRGSYEALYKIAIAVGSLQSLVLLVSWGVFLVKALI